MHRHKLHKIPDNWNLTGQSEVRNIIEQFLPRVEGEPAGPSVKKNSRRSFIPPGIYSRRSFIPPGITISLVM